VAVSARKKISGWLWRVWDFILFAIPFVLPPGAGGMTAYSAWLENEPSHLILLYSLAAFCLCAVAIAAVHYVIRHRVLFERLRYARTEPIMVQPDLEKKTVGIFFKCSLQNMSLTRSMYVSVKRADLRLQGRVHPEPTHLDKVIIVPAFSDFSIASAAVPEVDTSKEIRGRMEVEILYGPSPDDLPYLLEYDIDANIDIRKLTLEGGQLIFAAPVKKYLHRRV
jgi:hypothetical protein